MKKETAIGIASLLSDAQEWITRKEPARATDLINQAKEQVFASVKPQDFGHLLFSPLEADVHPWEWISALLADYKTLRDKAAAAGIVSDDPAAENEMLAHVGRFCEGAAALNQQTGAAALDYSKE
jgi:hypothetical protein